MTHKFIKVKKLFPASTRSNKRRLPLALICKVTLLSTLVTCVACSPQFVANQVLCLLRQLNRSVCPTPNIVNSILLHQLFRHVRLVIRTRNRTCFCDPNRSIFPCPFRPLSSGMLFESFGNICRFSHIPLVVLTFQNIQCLSGTPWGRCRSPTPKSVCVACHGKAVGACHSLICFQTQKQE